MGKKIRNIEQGLDLITAGIAKSVTSTAEYDGNEYTATFTAKGDKQPSPVNRASDPCSIMLLSCDLERALIGSEGRDYIAAMPWLTLPAGFSFKVTFPFAGAAARFRVCKTDRPESDVSVYLDTKDVLGCFGAPYWEAYPIDGDTARFALAEGKELIDAIVSELGKEQKTI